jgi:hypothetical protein
MNVVLGLHVFPELLDQLLEQLLLAGREFRRLQSPRGRRSFEDSASGL